MTKQLKAGNFWIMQDRGSHYSKPHWVLHAISDGGTSKCGSTWWKSTCCFHESEAAGIQGKRTVCKRCFPSGE